MRLVQITVPTGKRETVRRALEDEGVDYVFTDESSSREYAAVAFFPLPQNAVEPVLERLHDAGIDEESYTIVVDANTVVSRKFEQLEAEYAENGSDEDRISRQELRSAAADLMPTTRNYVALTIVSAVVATAGLLLNSASVVVGSMVIAPLVGPALSASVGTVIDDASLRARGVVLQVVGIAVAIASAAAFALFVQVTNMVPPGTDILGVDQIRERLAPDFLALAIALGAGVAGALSLSTGVSAALVGVMIAVALIPPAGVVGIGIAWGIPSLALGALVFVVVNVLSINLAALAVLWYQGYRPRSWFQRSDVRRKTLTRIGVLAGVILLLSVFLGGVTFASYQGAQAEETIRAEAEGVIDEHDDLVLLNIEYEAGDGPFDRTPESTVVTVGTPTADSGPPIAAAIDQRIQETAGIDIAVEVRYVRTERS